MSDIQALAAQTHGLTGSINAWNSWYMIFVAGTGLLAAAVFLTQFVVIKKSKELAGVQGAQMIEKDRQLAVDLRDKDLKIADAQRAAAEANERTARLLAEIQPRDLSTEQQLEIIEAIRPFRSPRSFVGIFNVWDADSTRLAKIFGSILDRSGLTPLSRGGGSTGIGGELSEGISIVLRDPASFKSEYDPVKTRAFAAALYKALQGKLAVAPPRLAKPEEGINVGSDVLIVIGVKPWHNPLTTPKP